MIASSPISARAQAPGCAASSRGRPGARMVQAEASHSKRGVARRVAVAAPLAGLLAAAAPAWAAPKDRPQELEASESPLIQELLKKSQENKEKYDKQRLDDYYARNFSDYFKFTASTENRSLDPEIKRQMQQYLKDHPGY